MRAKAQKWGNSLAVRIPKVIADQAGVQEEDELDIEADKDIIRLTRRRRELTLDELLQGITPDNVHGEQDFGQPEGAELW